MTLLRVPPPPGATAAQTGEDSHWAPAGGNYTPTHLRRSQRVTQNTRATPGAITPTPAQIQSWGQLCPHRQVLFGLWPWPIRLGPRLSACPPMGAYRGQQYAHAGRRSQCVTHTQHRGRMRPCRPKSRPGASTPTPAKEKCGSRRHSWPICSGGHPRFCPATSAYSNLRPSAGSNFRFPCLASQALAAILGDQKAEAGYIGPLFALPRGRGPRRGPACMPCRAFQPTPAVLPTMLPWG